jgi:adenylate cyclase
MGSTASRSGLALRAAEPRTRVRLLGSLELVLEGRSVAGQLHGRQARLVASYLVTHRERPVDRGELIAMLWPEGAPRDPQAQLRPILSGLRRALGTGALEGREQVRLSLPEPVWVDAEAAAAAVTAARAAAGEGDWRGAREQAKAALDLLEAGFLPGEDAEWIEAHRRELEETRLEALEWAARSALAIGGTELAVAEKAARQLVARSPYRETGYRYLMEAYAAEGNAAEALRVYEELRSLLREELGMAPAPELRELHERILCGEGAPGVERVRDRLPRPAALVGAERAALEGERKQVTVLFADVVGSQELQEGMDAEDWRALMDRFFQILAAGVQRFEGTVDKFTGDGIMALFGAPIAHEDHARRACHAALHLQRELAAYAEELHRERRLSFSVRIGLNSGEVVVGTIGRDLAMTYTAVGYTVGLAQRMEELAAADRIYVSRDTASLAEGYFTLTDLGEFQIKGATGPLRVFELTGTGPARVPIDAARARGLTRFVGREHELRALEDALEDALASSGQVIGVVGEPGVGKSRLSHELAERCRAKDIPVYHVVAQAHAKAVPLMPLLQFLRSYFEITERDSDEAARERIADKLLALEQAFADELPLLFDFLAVPDPERPVERMDPEARQRRLLALMKRLSYAQGAREPILLVIEDLHWLDPASEVFLANHVEAVPGRRGLTVVNFRPEYQAEWMSRSYYRQIALAPLGSAAVEELLAELLGSDPSLDRVSQLIRERARGNPFFIEELVRSLVEAGGLGGERGAYRLAQPIEQMAVPATIQAVLAARIDRLPAREKGVLQAAAVIGKEFSGPILEAVAGEPELEERLRRLVTGEFVHEQEPHPEPTYAFKHPLTREVAYSSQLTERRRDVHAAVARAIVDHYPERLEERAALVGQHWEVAGEKLEAARWYARAAAWSGTSDPTDALRHWDKVRELADGLPESAETVELGLSARTNALNYGWRLGISEAAAAAAFTEAERIASRAGDVRSRASLLAVYGIVRGQAHGQMRDYASFLREAAALAEESGDGAMYVAIAATAIPLLFIGELREGVAMLDRALELAGGDPSVGAGITVACPLAYCQVVKGGFLSNMGELAEGRRLIEEGRRLAGEHGDVESVGWSHMWSAWLEYYAGEPEAMRGHAQRTVEIAERIGDAFSRAYAWFFLGWAEWMRGEWRRSIDASERSRQITSRRGSGTAGEPMRIALLADCHFHLGAVERSRALAREGLEIARARGSTYDEMFTRLFLARVLLGADGPAAREEVEATLVRALELARTTATKAVEPQVHVGLAELARQLGDEERRARELRAAYRLFTEIGATGHAERLSAALEAPAG